MANEVVTYTMVELVDVMVKSLVDKPGDVSVTAQEAVGGVITLHVRVDAADLGKVIGKHGKTARSMRTILGAASATSGVVCGLNIVEPGEEAAS